jgi:uncharacterized protein
MRFHRALRNFAALLVAVTFFAALTALGRAAPAPIPAAPTQWVTDTAGYLSPAAVQTLDARLGAYQQQTGHQVIVYVAPTTGDAPIEDWAVRAFKQWKVGRQGKDDGVALFIFTKDRKLRIEVGYGLEATLTDAQSSRILREAVQPELSAGHPDAAVTAGVAGILQTLGGETARAPAAADAAGTVDVNPGVVLLIVIVVFGLLLLAVRNPWTALWLLTNILSGSRSGYGGDSSSGRGGFSGGGGRSGGGGASGSW